MARPKRNSSVLEKTKRRLESLLSIDPRLDLGNGKTVATFSAVIDDLDTKLAKYNTTLSIVDQMADDIKVAEKAAKAMAEQMLLGVASRYGKTSQEYEMAGGSRRKGQSYKKSTSTVESESFDTVPMAMDDKPFVNGSQNGSQPASTAA